MKDVARSFIVKIACLCYNGFATSLLCETVHMRSEIVKPHVPGSFMFTQYFLACFIAIFILNL